MQASAAAAHTVLQHNICMNAVCTMLFSRPISYF